MKQKSKISTIVIWFTAILSLSGQDSKREVYFSFLSFREVLDYFEKHYDYTFSYNPESLPHHQIPIPKHIDNNNIDIYLSEFFDAYQIEYKKLSNKNYLLKYKTNSKNVERPINISGQVLDKITNTPLEYVNIWIEGSGKGTVTDKNGRFCFSISKDLTSKQLSIHSIGYYDKTYTVANLVNYNKKIYLEFKEEELDEVEVVEKIPTTIFNPSSTDYFYQSNHTKFTNTGVSFTDGLFPMTKLAGVQSSTQGGTSIKVRGLNDQYNLILLDGIPVYNSNHYYGVFSAINGLHFSKAKLYKNDFPIEYGSKIGGLLTIESTNKIGFGTKAEFIIDRLTGNFAVKHNLNSKTSLQIAGRKSLFQIENTSLSKNNNSDIYTRKDIVLNQPKFEFFDYNAQVQHEFNPMHKIDFNIFGAKDNFADQFYTKRLKGKSEFQETYNNTEMWTNNGVSLNLKNQWAKNFTTNLTTNYAISDIKSQLKHDVLTIDHIKTLPMGDRDTIHRSHHTLKIKLNNIKSFSSTISTRYKSTEQLELVFGAILNNYKTYSKLNPSDTNFIFNSAKWENRIFGAIEWQSKKIDMSLGMHSVNYLNKWSLCPRLHINYALRPNFILKSAFHTEYQFLQNILVENDFSKNQNLLVLANGKNIRPLYLRNIMGGVNYKIGKLQVEIEYYDKKLDNIIQLGHRLNQSPVISRLENEVLMIERPKIFNAFGHYYGIDITMNLDIKNTNIYGAYSWSKSLHKIREVDHSAEFYAPNDRRHQLKIGGSILLGKLQLGTDYVFSSGRPYQGVDVVNNISHFTYYTLPPYLRTDFSAKYNLKINRIPITLFISVYNVFNRLNVEYHQNIILVRSENFAISKNKVIGTESSLLPRYLNFGFSIKLQS